MSHTIDSLNRAGAAARIAELEAEVARRRVIISEACEMGLELGRRLELRDAEVARLRALVALGVEVTRAWVSDASGCDECGAGPDMVGRTACGHRIIVVRDHESSCLVGRFLREAGEVGRV